MSKKKDLLLNGIKKIVLMFNISLLKTRVMVENNQYILSNYGIPEMFGINEIGLNPPQET